LSYRSLQSLSISANVSKVIDFWRVDQQNDGRKSKGLPFFLNKYLKNAFGNPSTRSSCDNP